MYGHQPATPYHGKEDGQAAPSPPATARWQASLRLNAERPASSRSISTPSPTPPPQPPPPFARPLMRQALVPQWLPRNSRPYATGVLGAR
uniref:Uncharacterized protein n=1 Tax=Oryza sativa subsp. japonica TaxID=39947 RepID=Q6YTG3_ORYSJ|nr:hypothetical protein [Oryza sativa Japonica Group]BAD17774.1 hypothetical protein [Oryza sativa Japonica Group]